MTDWTGNKNQIDLHLDREKRSANLLDEDELYNQDYDKGKVSPRHNRSRYEFNLWTGSTGQKGEDGKIGQV